MPMQYDHIVRFDPILRRVTIMRLESENRETLFTHLDLPEKSPEGWSEAVIELARRIGEDILIDSPVARAALNL